MCHYMTDFLVLSSEQQVLSRNSMLAADARVCHRLRRQVNELAQKYAEAVSEQETSGAVVQVLGPQCMHNCNTATDPYASQILEIQVLAGMSSASCARSSIWWVGDVPCMAGPGL